MEQARADKPPNQADEPPAQSEKPPAQAGESPTQPLPLPPKKGQLYEVVFSSVWVRRSPDSAGARLTKRLKGDRVRIFDFDESGNWGKVEVKVKDGLEEGWMLLEHEEIGVLLAPCEDDDDEGGLLKPDQL